MSREIKFWINPKFALGLIACAIYKLIIKYKAMALITPFDPWQGNYCSCPKKYSLSAYTGCGHGCLYCYASSYIRDFFTPRAKKNYLINLEKEIKKIPEKSLIALANSSDPYQPLEEKLNLTRQTLLILKNYNLRINLVTKSALILKDIAILKEFRVKPLISITLTTLNEKLCKKLEPYTCLPKARLKAMEKLVRHFSVTCRIDPLIYPLNSQKFTSIIKQVKNCGVKQIITSTYKIKPDNFRRMVKIFPNFNRLWHKLYYAEGQKISGYAYLPLNLRKKIIEDVKQAALKENLYFSSCREGLSKLNTKNCDGSSLLES